MQRTTIQVIVVLAIVSTVGCTREKPFSPDASSSQPQSFAPPAVSTAPGNLPTVVSLAPTSLPTGSVLSIQPSADLTPSAPNVVAPIVNPTSASPILPDKTTSYTVLPGDWLSKVARQFNTSNDALLAANPGIDPDLLVPGQTLKIPWSSGPTLQFPPANPVPPPNPLPLPPQVGPFPPIVAAKKYIVKPGDWFYAIARRYNVSVDALQSANPGINPNAVYPGITLNIPDSSTGNPPPPYGPTTSRSVSPPRASPGIPPTIVRPPSTALVRTPTAVPTSGGVPVQTGSLGYGTQVNWTNVDHDQEMAWIKGLGFGWAKAQVRWCDFEPTQGSIDYGLMDHFINAAGAKGTQVLFSIVCAPGWSRADGGLGGSGPPDDFQKAADFMGLLASRYCGKSLAAIEVWNEQNLVTEWHGKPISAASYMDMLRRSHLGIKARCSSILVISGSLTPTGVNSSTAIDDVAYLQQMYASGLKQYSDAVGAHPSGFCNSPDAVEGASNPCNGQFNNHRSFFFKRTIESYRSVMVQNGESSKRLWVTEFGWAVDPSPKPGYEYAKFISEDLQASWEVKAFQNMKAYGYIGVAFLWNLDFTEMSSETGAFHILNRRAYNSLAGMVK